MRETPEDSLYRRYIQALALVALLVLVNQILVQPPLLRLTTDAPVINIAGRQRMLSQRLTKASLAMVRVDDQDARVRHRSELEYVLTLWSTSHDGLIRGNRALSLPGRNSDQVRAAFADLEPYYERMHAAAARLVREQTGRPADTDSENRDLAIILQAEPEFLDRMDHIVGLYEHEASARVDRLRWTGWLLAALILLALALIARYILGPAEQVIRRQLLELRAARIELEERVRERTRELEQANQHLAREAAGRSLAEERHRALVEQFSHVSRTNTIGEMASGLAHEINQPLGAIANYTEGCLVELDSPHPALDEVRAALEKVLAITLRAGQIIQRIRRFVTRHAPSLERFEPNRVAEEVAALLRDEATRRGIGVVLDLAPDLPELWGDPVQIQQVLVNLMSNAFEALAASQSSDPVVVMKTRRGPSRDVEFSVIDNGEGIPEESLAQVFDAYFSTRAEGMGMGLAISRTIVEFHHGRISVDSEPGIRTTFRFTLPESEIGDG
jgi:two-component system sensor kinase FixL